MARAPVLSHPPELLLRGQDVRVAFFDVDGVLTDGSLYFTELPDGDARGAAETIKRFHTLDGMGIKLLQAAGIAPAVVTGRDSVALRARLKALGVVHARFGTEDKRPAAEAILAELGLEWSAAAAIGSIDALYRQDATALGESLPGTLMSGYGSASIIARTETMAARKLLARDDVAEAWLGRTEGKETP